MALKNSSIANTQVGSEPTNASELLEMYDKKPATKMSFKIIIAIIVLFLLGGVMMMLSSGKKGEDTGSLINSILAQQSQMIALSDKTTRDLKTAKARNTMLSLGSVLATDQKAISSAATKAAIKLPKQTASSELSAATLKEINTAELSADYDTKILALLKVQLTEYQVKLKATYNKTKSTSLKSVLDKAYSNSEEFSSGL